MFGALKHEAVSKILYNGAENKTILLWFINVSLVFNTLISPEIINLISTIALISIGLTAMSLPLRYSITLSVCLRFHRNLQW